MQGQSRQNALNSWLVPALPHGGSKPPAFDAFPFPGGAQANANEIVHNPVPQEFQDFLSSFTNVPARELTPHSPTLKDSLIREIVTSEVFHSYLVSEVQGLVKDYIKQLPVGVPGLLAENAELQSTVRVMQGASLSPAVMTMTILERMQKLECDMQSLIKNGVNHDGADSGLVHVEGTHQLEEYTASSFAQAGPQLSGRLMAMGLCANDTPAAGLAKTVVYDTSDKNEGDLKISEESIDRKAKQSKDSSAPQSGHQSRGTLHEEVSRHTLRGSVWEMIIVVKLGWCDAGASIQLTTAFLVNLLMQVILVCVLFTTFIGDHQEVQELESFRHWRLTEGHNYINVNSLSAESLVSRICRYDHTLGSFGDLTLLLGEIDDYKEPLLGLSTGLCLVLVVNLVWTFTVVSDCLLCVTFMHGVLSISTAPETRLMGTRDGGELELEFVEMSEIRKIFIASVSCLRVGISVCFLYVGCEWLSSTYDMKDLLLNCVALGFVFSLDDLCFEILAPADVQVLSQHIKPLKKLKAGGWSIARILRLWILLIAIVFFGLMTAIAVVPMSNRLNDVNEVLCSGRRNFAIGLNQDTRLLYATLTTTGDEEAVWPGGKPAEIALVKGLIESEDFDSVQGVVFVDHFQDLHDSVEMPIETLVANSAFSCEDTITRKSSYALETVQRYNVNPDGKTCNELKGSCFDPYENYLRTNCPVTCGAASPLSGMFLDTPAYGVPDTCRQSSKFLIEYNAIPCVDTDMITLNAMEGWNRTWQLLVDHQGRQSSAQHVCYMKVMDLFLQQGCPALSNLPSCSDYTIAEFCSLQRTIPRVQWFCPVACGCATNLYNNSDVCPPACASRAP